MAKRKYYLYLDEMLENLIEGPDYFSLAGYIILEQDRDILDKKIAKLKNDFGITRVFHWTDFRQQKPEWRDETKTKQFLSEFTQIIDETDMTVIASMFDVKLVLDHMKSKKWLSRQHVYGMKKIIENFFIYLNKENATHDDVEGHIIVESSSIDEELQKLFHSVMIFGTDFISQLGLTKFIKSIEFIKKAENNNLLQVADLMPSEIYRLKKDNDSFSKKLKPFKSEIIKLRNVIESKSFSGDGANGRKDLYGINIFE